MTTGDRHDRDDGRELRRRAHAGTVTTFSLPASADRPGVDVCVRHSSRARRLRLTVRPDATVQLVVPRGVGAREIESFVGRHAEWIARATARRNRPSRLGLDVPGVVWRDLEPIPIATTTTTRSGVRVGLDSVGLRVTRHADATDDDIVAAIERWYRRQARMLIAEAVGREEARLGVRHTSIAIRDQRTRWGSCSRRGTLSFNWRLVVAPRDVREYVVVHELCHLRELNHSNAFWRLLDTVRPQWREQAAWLREYGAELQRLRVTPQPPRQA